jgi:glycosidase
LEFVSQCRQGQIKVLVGSKLIFLCDTKEKFKELIDICHQNGIAVILDLALNHSFGRNPGVRMWMNDPDGDGWGLPATDNPYYNTTARHSYSVGEDFNHQSALTQYYTRRVNC